MANVKAEPKHMDEIDYFLNELNATDDEKINVIKAQIKGAYNSLKDLINELKVEIKFLKEDYFDKLLDSDYNDYTELKNIFDKYYELQAKYFILKQKVDKNNETK